MSMRATKDEHMHARNSRSLSKARNMPDSLSLSHSLSTYLPTYLFIYLSLDPYLFRQPKIFRPPMHHWGRFPSPRLLMLCSRPRSPSPARGRRRSSSRSSSSRGSSSRGSSSSRSSSGSPAGGRGTSKAAQRGGRRGPPSPPSPPLEFGGLVRSFRTVCLSLSLSLSLCLSLSLFLPTYLPTYGASKPLTSCSSFASLVRAGPIRSMGIPIDPDRSFSKGESL